MDENFEKLEEQQIQGISEFNMLKARFRAGKVAKINRAEREILEFCHGRDMVEFVREEFRRNPILYDEYGNVIDNPKYSVGGCPQSYINGAGVNLVRDDGRDVLTEDNTDSDYSLYLKLKKKYENKQ